MKLKKKFRKLKKIWRITKKFISFENWKFEEILSAYFIISLNLSM